MDKRTAALGVGEFSSFTLGPRESGDGVGGGIWRAHLGTHWHNELRTRATAEHGAAATFEIPITGQVAHRGWTLTLTGRIDQLIQPPAPPADSGPPPETASAAGAAASTHRARRAAATRPVILREIKSVTRPLPADETELRRDYPDYFVQIATYLALGRSGLLRAATPAADAFLPGDTATVLRGELVFVETSAGLVQTLTLASAEDALFTAQLERVVEFLNLRLRARERLRGLRYRPPFPSPRPGQETTLTELTTTFEQRPLVLFEAPTGFGKTGVMLEFALGQLRSGHFDRVLYLTSKSTGQIQVVDTLGRMTAPEESPAAPGAAVAPTPDLAQPGGTAAAPVRATPVAVWHVRNKGEHCVNATFHCVRDNCQYLAGAPERWGRSGLARFYLDEQHARDLETLRAAGREARICPYEITRAALAFNDVWIGDYNYVFAPGNRGLFYDQPGFLPARTLLLVDEAHNLPNRVADAYSHGFTATDAYTVREDLNRIRPPASLLSAWDHWCHFLHHLRPSDGLSADDEDDARHLLGEIAKHVSTGQLDYAALGPYAADALWSVPALLDELEQSTLPRLWWSPRGAELALTCLDAAPAIGATLREFGGVVLASATLTPVDGFAAACGLAREAAPVIKSAPSPEPAQPLPERLGELNKRTTRKLYKQLTTAAQLLRVEEARDAATPTHLRAHAPWRDGTYDVAFDARVDTTFQHRSRFYPETGATVVALQDAAHTPVAVFFPSYAYADAIRQELATSTPEFRVAVQPKVRDLAAQGAWVEESLSQADALFLVLGSSFAESIDVLGGRISHAMIIGPALPEVNAVQRARLAEAARQGLSRDAAFRQVYQIPGMTKVNQALGRLVRAPGHRARVLLHCRRFTDAGYRDLLAPEYQAGTTILDDLAFAAWLNRA
ncbi:helicase C-terminal domain-containing protein [Opitutus sp. ER46]|uniref:ATP-dependent DNA helicase n=1 Tax=Opitutus sp. ER46 TaxID=2161864 RepID=UPI001E322B1D|nr:helicase C-terminal domain-containing protein [Opitutus sp. ER46]